MSGFARVTGRLERAVTAMGRAVELAFLAIVVVGLLCVIALMVAGTYGILHEGDDFGFNNGGGGDGGGDVIAPYSVL